MPRDLDLKNPDDTRVQERINEDSLNQLEVIATSLGVRLVACPLIPAIIIGSDSATALESGDTVGTVFTISVPKAGVIWSAILYDFDDEGTQVDLEIYKARIVDVAVDAAYAPTDIEGLDFITELNFFSFDDHGVFQTSEIRNIGKAYSIPYGTFYCQAVTRSTPTIAAGVPHRVQLQIQSFDPDFKER